MKEFVLIFRMDITTREAQPSDEQMQVYMTHWMQWLDDISAKGQLANGGNHLSSTGCVLRGKDIRDNNPYTVDRESVAGYIIVLAKDLEGAITLARACPILNGQGTSVEVRQTAMPG